jgi:hypothetical protein
MKLPRSSFLLLSLALWNSACSQETPEASPWGITVGNEPIVTEGSFAVGAEMSGIASLNGTDALLVSNETRVAQLGILARSPWRLTAGREIPLKPPLGDAECDFEAVAADASSGFYYVLGSHAVAKKKAKPRPEQQALFRLPSAGEEKVPDPTKTDDIQSVNLTPWLTKIPEIAPAIGKPLQRNGLNLEGLAAKEGKLWIGFRAPHLDGKTPVLEVAAYPLFTQPLEAWPSGKLYLLPLGKGLGIRDLAPLQDGFLLLAGQAGSEASNDFPIPENYDGDGTFTLFHWRPEAPKPLVRVGNLPVVKGKAEGLLILSESATSIEIIVLYDGGYNGAPKRFTLSKPKQD